MRFNKDKEVSKKRIALLISAMLIFIIFSAFISVKLYPLIIAIASSPEKMMEFKVWIESYGIWGGVMLMTLQVLQVIVSVVPGGPVQILFGLIYGTWKGLLLSLIGMTLGSVTVFFLVRAFKYKFITVFMCKEKLDEYRFLKDSPRLEKILALLFLIPGVPKDTLVYYVGMTDLNIKKFIWIVVLMRIPSMMFSTFIGNNIGMGNMMSSFLVLSALCLAGLAGMVYNRCFIKKSNEKSAYQQVM